MADAPDLSLFHSTNLESRVKALENGLIIVDTVQFNDVSINPNYYGAFTASAAKTGYTPLGIVGFAAVSGGGSCTIMEYELKPNGNVSVYLRNHGTAMVTVKGARVKMLYIKNINA